MTALPLFTPLKAANDGTLSGRIVRQIRAALFSGELIAGQFLGSEATLAARFGVSRMAMRDALRSLQAAGIVDVRVGARGGAYVARGNHEQFADALAIQLKLIGVSVEEIFDAQIAIEVSCVEQAATNARPQDFAALRGVVAEMAALAAGSMPAAALGRFNELALRFHEGLVEASHNRVLIAQFKALRFVLEPLHRRALTPEVAERVVASHDIVLKLLEQGDGAGARARLHARLQIVRARQVAAAVQPAELEA